MNRGYFARTGKYETRDGGRGKLRKPLPPHGTRNRYRHRIFPCKCRACTTANSKATRRKKPKQQVAWVTSDAITKEEYERVYDDR